MDSPIIDLVILLTFTYFTSSLILSSINEGISQGIFHLREKNLKKAIEVLFFSDEWKKFVQTDFNKSPHIRSLMKKSGKYPTNIPANNFFLFVIEKIGSANLHESKLQQSIKDADLPPDFKSVLLDLAAQGDNKLESFEKNLTQFYDDALERSTVWYRKNIRRILLMLGFLLSVAMNIDTIKIANDALSNTKDMGKTVDKIIDQIPNIEVSDDSVQIVNIKNDKGEILVSQQIVPKNAVLDTINPGSASSIKNVDKLRVSYQETTGYFLGYQQGEFMDQWFGHGFVGFLVKLLGMLITAFAVQLGSNYWFDIMKKAISMRTPGKKVLPSQPASK
jgi:hypothetical protein